MDANQSATTRRILHACDNCRARKVRCNGDTTRCQQCTHLGLQCVFSPVKASRKSRSEAARGSVIARLKQPAPQAPPSSPPSASTALHPKHFFKGLLAQYEQHVYCVNPVITPAEMLTYIDAMEGNLVNCALAHAYAAVTLNLTTPNWKSDPRQNGTISALVDHASVAHAETLAEVMKTTGRGAQHARTERVVMTAIFIQICLMAFARYDEAFVALRGAISILQLLRVDRLSEDQDEQSCTSLPQRERMRRIRMYWEAYIHERFLAVVAYYPPVLSGLSLEKTLVIQDPNLDVSIHDGFRGLVQLFTILDSDFIDNWLSIDRGHVKAEWIEAKRLQLDSLDFLGKEGATNSTADSPGILGTPSWSRLTILQQADLIVTRQWMLTLLWQLAVSSCLLPSHSSPHAPSSMSLQFPVRLSRHLRQIVGQFGRQNIERHGSGILQKLFEITTTFADVLIHVPARTAEEHNQQRDDLDFLIGFLHQFAGLSEMQERILREKEDAVASVGDVITRG